MADQPQTAADVLQIVEEENIRFIRFWFTDILGQLKSFSIGREQLETALTARVAPNANSVARPTRCNGTVVGSVN